MWTGPVPAPPKNARALGAISRVRRAVSRRMLLHWRPDLLVEYRCKELKKRACTFDLPRKCKNLQHWMVEADRLCKTWGITETPTSMEALLASLSATWRREAVAACSTQYVTKARDPWSKAQKIVESFGLAFDTRMREDIRQLIAPKQQTLIASLQRGSKRAAEGE